ncbi:MAG: heparinase II/III family protein, partial [Armatimonadota bacterium]
DSPAWNDDLRRTVEDTLFRDALELSLTVHEDMGGHITNLNPTLYQRMIHLGRVLNEPDVVHQAVRFMQDMIRMSYHFDGMEFEGAMAYHGVVTGRLGIGVRMLEGYVDPEGYEDERFGYTIGRGENPLDFPIHSKAWDVWSMMKYPDGHQVYIHDTNWVVGRPEVEEDAVIPNIVLNAYGHYALGGGIGRDGMQAHLHFCPGNRGPHYHADRLSMILWGADEELLPDIGYQHVGRPARYFANRQTAHNMIHVLFDEEPQAPEVEEPTDLPTDPVEHFKAIAEAERSLIDARSRVLAYDSGTASDGRVQLVSASSPGPAWMGIDRRERSLLMVRVDDRRSYLVDVFRVQGGDRHRFILRGSADEDMRVAHALDLEAVPGTLAGEDVPYGEHAEDAEPYTWFVHNLRRAEVAEPWEMTWTGEASGSSVRMFVAGDAGSEVTLGESPSLRRANQDPRRAHDFMAPHLLVERDDSGAGNLFAAVYDVWPDESSPAVQSVSFERLDEGAEAPLAVRVELADGREDVVYASLDREQREVGGARVAGPWAVVSSADGVARWAWTHDGAAAADGLEASARRRMELPLVEVRRVQGGDDANALVVEGAIPDAEDLEGRWVRALLGDGAAYAYEVAAVQSGGDRTIIEIAGEPGFELAEDGGWELLFNPFYEGDGPCRVDVARSAFASVR